MPSRRQLRSLIHLGIFVTLLCTILYITSPSSPSKTFAWNTVKYKTPTPAKDLPKANGVCPGLSKSGKPALVVNHVSTDGDTAWLSSLSEKYHLCIYEVDSSGTESDFLSVPANRGHESISYLTFLIDNYSSIPSSGAVFIHGSRYAWHNDHQSYDNLPLLQDLNIDSALSLHGYHNLRCDWSLSTCPSTVPAQGSFENTFQASTSPWDKKAVSDAALPSALSQIFGSQETKLGRADAVRSQCCAQFVVSRSKIHSHSAEEYFALRQWLLDGSSSSPSKISKNAAPADDRVAGRILSYVWHILFLKEGDGDEGANLSRLNVQACPSAEECYCRLYGRCDLSCPNSGTCYGQYELPPNLKVDQQGRSGAELKS